MVLSYQYVVVQATTQALDTAPTLTPGWRLKETNEKMGKNWDPREPVEGNSTGCKSRLKGL